MRILITDGISPATKERLVSLGHQVVEQSYPPETLGNALRAFDLVIVRSATKIRKPQIDAATGSRLKLIIRAGVGLDNIDLDAARAAGIQVRATPAASTNAVAELTIALLFSCARSIGQASHSMKSGLWEKKAYAKGFELLGKTIGIIGYGRIGQRVGELAQAVGMRVIAHEPSVQIQRSCPEIQFVSMEQLCSEADVISLHLPAMDSPVITAERIRQMRDGVVILNASRGANVDEDALLDALCSGKVRAAGLDVWSQEPNRNTALAAHPRVSCTPHLGASTLEAQDRIGQEILSIVESFAG